MESIFKSILILIQFSNLTIELSLNRNEINDQNIDKSIEQSYSLDVSLKERINLCESNLADFNYNSLNEDEQDWIFNSENPCRVDCVVHRPRTIVFTFYFIDGKFECAFQRVCVSDPSHTYGVCHRVTNESITTRTITLLSTVSTFQITNSTILSTNHTLGLTTTESHIMTSSTSAPTSSNRAPDVECESARFFRDKTDPECHRFYRCIGFVTNFKRVDLKCPNGTMFDEPIQSCQYPDELIQPCPQIDSFYFDK